MRLDFRVAQLNPDNLRTYEDACKDIGEGNRQQISVYVGAPDENNADVVGDESSHKPRA